MARDVTRPVPGGAARARATLPADDRHTTIRGAQQVAGTAGTIELPEAEPEVSA